MGQGDKELDRMMVIPHRKRYDRLKPEHKGVRKAVPAEVAAEVLPEVLKARREAAFIARQALKKEALQIFVKYEEDDLWDKINGKDVHPAIIEYVASSLERGWSAKSVRSSLNIRVDSDKRWRKILAAIRQGVRINSTALMKKWMARNEIIQDKLYGVLRNNMEDLNDNFDPEKSAAISQLVENISRLQQGTVRIGKDLGAFVDPTSGGQGVTIVVNSNIKLPDQKEVENHQNTINAIEVMPIEYREESKIKLPEE